jgi:hypothetical protein
MSHLDFHRLVERLVPQNDAETPIHHRTAIVVSVNSDGTLDIDLGGVTVTAPILDGAYAEPGDVVQVGAWAGDLLVLGRVASALSSAVSVLPTPWTPVLTATSTDPNLGADGVAEGFYMVTNGWCVGWGRFFFDGTGVNAGGGGYRSTLPVPRHPLNFATTALGNSPIQGRAVAIDSSAQGNNVVDITVQNSGSTVWCFMLRAGGQLGSGAPFAWATGDRLAWEFSYFIDPTWTP